MPQPLVLVDAFTAKPFGGNPAAVCVLPHAAEDAWMAAVAMEMNQAETAFLLKTEDGYHLRWFTPAVEVDLCGHATLASAHALWTEGHLPPGTPARFHTRSGLLTCEQSPNSNNGNWIQMDFPATPAAPVEPPPQIAEALGAEPTFIGRNQFDYLIEVAGESTLRALRPNFYALRELPVRGLIVTAQGAGEYDFVSRFFAPACGIDEDPVTGSAHCTLAPYWAAKLAKAEMTGFQASRRGGVVKVQVNGDRVLLLGQAVTVLRGELAA
jgi:PhzF family phenazine biosynthesis protein